MPRIEEVIAEQHERARAEMSHPWWLDRKRPGEVKIPKILKPENCFERAFIRDDSFRKGCLYGKPRPGHPEGQVLYHIRHVLGNIDRYSNENNRHDLRLVAFTHDTFKYCVDPNKPKTGKNHHGVIAKKFAWRYLRSRRTLQTIELHDEAYNAWRQGSRNGYWSLAEERAQKLIDTLAENLDFYLAFFKCDNNTPGKTPKSYEWFESLSRK